MVSRNLRHFTATGVATLDPWQGELAVVAGRHCGRAPGYRGPAPARRLSMNRKGLTIAAPNNTRRVPGREGRSVSAR
ncbi:hypothetical protein [Vulcanococcus limneticus]|uniref:hypothetical protein n=1 Tax=Vulcanococcus limneticus TaxID=2170428 RepID=UPI00398BCA76